MSATQSSFQRKKQKILEGLGKSANEYTDLSPKGSVDAGIRDLIEEINQLDGIVTTSSCAGRISVYLEGRKDVHRKGSNVHHAESDVGTQDHQLAQATVPGGKGAGGRWLYVSHDPLQLQHSTDSDDMHLMKLFGLFPCLTGPGTTVDKATRYVRVAFEPMVRPFTVDRRPGISLMGQDPSRNDGFPSACPESAICCHQCRVPGEWRAEST